MRGEPEELCNVPHVIIDRLLAEVRESLEVARELIGMFDGPVPSVESGGKVDVLLLGA
jgi:hypothetical protein